MASQLFGYITNTEEPPKYDDILNSGLDKEQQLQAIQMRGQNYNTDLDELLNRELNTERLKLGLELGGAALGGLGAYRSAKLIGKTAPTLFKIKRLPFNPNDGIKRTLYDEQQALEYIKRNYPAAGAESVSEFYQNLPLGGVSALRKQWKKYAKDNFIGEDIDIPGYTTGKFTNTNLGEDYPHNLPEYPNLFDNLKNSSYKFSTNYKNEKDRFYDHLINSENNNLFDYLYEVLRDTEGKVHHNYKMMKNLKKGDKP